MVSNVQGGRSGARLHCLSLKSAVMTMYDVLSDGTGTHTIYMQYVHYHDASYIVGLRLKMRRHL